jgi:thiol:disulfide interchange protein DsbD
MGTGAAPGGVVAPAPGTGFTTGPPAGGERAVALGNPLARAFEHGGFAAFLAFLGIFGTGLALNLTPCVYPMLGVTLSIFGARRAAPPLQVFGLALTYVLGMAAMYTTLGVIAALTGGLFGSALQSPLVSVGIGVLMIALALSMFGLYQLQPPAALLSKLGGANATSAIGVFLSGLVVGVFAAPCIGPPVVGAARAGRRAWRPHVRLRRVLHALARTRRSVPRARHLLEPAAQPATLGRVDDLGGVARWA